MTQQQKEPSPVRIDLHFPGSEEPMSFDADELPLAFERMMTITSATVSYTKNILPAQFKSESPFLSMTVDLNVWQNVPRSLLVDPVKGPVIWASFMKAMNNRLGKATRYVYSRVLSSVLERAIAFNLPEAKVLQQELAEFNSPGAYDPYRILVVKETPNAKASEAAS